MRNGAGYMIASQSVLPGVDICIPFPWFCHGLRKAVPPFYHWRVYSTPRAAWWFRWGTVLLKSCEACMSSGCLMEDAWAPWRGLILDLVRFFGGTTAFGQDADAGGSE